MRRKRDGNPEGTVADKIQDARRAALEWRKLLQIDSQFRPDIAQILLRPTRVFPNIRVKTFAATSYRKQRVRGWANAKTRTINLADSVQRGLKYGDPQSRWDATHEIAHVALHHSGNNLLMGKPYSIQDRKFEDQVDAFVFEFLAPFHLAKSLSSVEEYERRFGIPRDKAIIRKHQIEELKRQEAVLPKREVRQKPEPLNSRSNIRARRNVRRDIFPSLIPEQLPLPFSQLSLQGDIALIEKTKSDFSRKPLETEIDATTRRSESTSHADSEDGEVLGALIRDANRTIRRYRRSIKASLGTIIMVIGCLPLLTNSVDGKIKIGALAATGLIGAALAFLQIIDRPIGLEKRLERLAWRILKNLAEKRGVTRKLEKHGVHYRQHKFVSSQQA